MSSQIKAPNDEQQARDERTEANDIPRVYVAQCRILVWPTLTNLGNVHFPPIADIGHGFHNCSMRAIILWLLLAIAAALACFTVRLGVPMAFGTQNDMTIEDASIRAALLFFAIVGLGWWYSRRQRY